MNTGELGCTNRAQTLKGHDLVRLQFRNDIDKSIHEKSRISGNAVQTLRK